MYKWAIVWIHEQLKQSHLITVSLIENWFSPTHKSKQTFKKINISPKLDNWYLILTNLHTNQNTHLKAKPCQRLCCNWTFISLQTLNCTLNEYVSTPVHNEIYNQLKKIKMLWNMLICYQYILVKHLHYILNEIEINFYS